jgi:hypothetical protein
MHRLTPVIAALCAGFMLAQKPPAKDPAHDSRLSVHTLVREDVFSGFLANDRVRLANGERTLSRLLIERPGAKASILAWQGWVALTRAVYAHEQNDPREFLVQYQKATDSLAEASRLSPDGSGGVAIITAGSYAMLGDRLPEKYRADAWERAYDMYRKAWARKGADIYAGPLHFKGEFLAGLAQSAQRTGRSKELIENLNLILEKLPGTPYAARAQKWKEQPEIAGRTGLICQTCHEPGRLAPRMAALAN